MRMKLLLLSLLVGVACARLSIEEQWEAVSKGGGFFTSSTMRGRRDPAVLDRDKTQLTHSDRKALLDAHNDARSNVKPTAANMPMMTWNATLENLAQRWARRCEFGHGQVRKDFSMGQNLWAGTDGYFTNGAVETWEMEKQNYTFRVKSSCADGEDCRQYTQVVWARTTEVGCGISYCDTLKNFRDDSWLVVCNYVKSGSFYNQLPYKKSNQSCSNCPGGYTSCINNLCRRDPLCGDLACVGAGTMDTRSCLCECGPDPNNELGPYCGNHPALEEADESANNFQHSQKLIAEDGGVRPHGNLLSVLLLTALTCAAIYTPALSIL